MSGGEGGGGRAGAGDTHKDGAVEAAPTNCANGGDDGETALATLKDSLMSFMLGVSEENTINNNTMPTTQSLDVHPRGRPPKPL